MRPIATYACTVVQAFKWLILYTLQLCDSPRGLCVTSDYASRVKLCQDCWSEKYVLPRSIVNDTNKPLPRRSVLEGRVLVALSDEFSGHSKKTVRYVCKLVPEVRPDTFANDSFIRWSTLGSMSLQRAHAASCLTIPCAGLSGCRIPEPAQNLISLYYAPLFYATFREYLEVRGRPGARRWLDLKTFVEGRKAEVWARTLVRLFFGGPAPLHLTCFPSVQP